MGAVAVRFTNLDKPLWSDGTTKGALIEYLIAVAPVMLPHLEGRPLTRKRFPDGSDAKGFFEKNAPSHTPEWVATAQVTERDEVATYVVADRPETLAWLGQLAAIELHAPLARAAAFDEPDLLVFDLDPGPGAGLRECGELALVVRGMLEQLGLDSVIKTSGGKGMQLYVGIEAGSATFIQTQAFAKQVALTLEQQMPDKVVSKQDRSLRPGKVLIDWGQNGYGKTTVAVYSARPGDAPSVSTPLEWHEVEDAVSAGEAEALRFGFSDVLARVDASGDVFRAVLQAPQRLPQL